MSTDEFYSSKTTVDQRIADCVTKRDILNDRIERLKQVKAVWDDLPFKEGAVAFHKEFGNVLTKSIEYGTKRRKYIIGKKYYIIGSMTGTLTVYTCVNESNKYGYFVTDNGVPFTNVKWLMILKPYTKAVKILHENKSK